MCHNYINQPRSRTGPALSGFYRYVQEKPREGSWFRNVKVCSHLTYAVDSQSTFNIVPIVTQTWCRRFPWFWQYSFFANSTIVMFANWTMRYNGHTAILSNKLKLDQEFNIFFCDVSSPFLMWVSSQSYLRYIWRDILVKVLSPYNRK